jgi:hypothetical protein
LIYLLQSQEPFKRMEENSYIITTATASSTLNAAIKLYYFRLSSVKVAGKLGGGVSFISRRQFPRDFECFIHLFCVVYEAFHISERKLILSFGNLFVVARQRLCL